MSYNPFSPGGIVKSSLFGGRSDYIIKILRRLDAVRSGNPASFYLYGERGIGKTALARLISYISKIRDKELYDLNFLTSYYSAQKGQSFRSILEASLNKIADEMDENTMNRIGSRLGDIFKNGKFKISAFGVEAGYEGMGQSNSRGEAISIKDQVVSILGNLLKELKKVKSETPQSQNDGVLVVIDEMDNIEDLDQAASIIRGITTELNFSNNGFLSFLFIGHEDGYSRFVKGDKSILRSLDSIQLVEMPDNEVKETFEKGFGEVKVTWDEQELESNLWKTGGYPLAIQIIGYHLIEVDTDEHIDSDDWNSSFGSCSQELIDKEFKSYYAFGSSKKTNSDKSILVLALASRFKNYSLSTKEIEEVSGVINPGQYLKKLLKNGTVNRKKSNGEYIIKKGLFRLAVILDYVNTHGAAGRSYLSELREKIALIDQEKENNLGQLKPVSNLREEWIDDA